MPYDEWVDALTDLGYDRAEIKDVLRSITVTRED